MEKELTSKQRNCFAARQLISEVSYSQIGQAVKLVARDTVIHYVFPEDRFDFVENDFGIVVDSMLDPAFREDFLRRHATMSEYDLYRHYLLKTGYDFEDANGQLDLAKVYDLLEFRLTPDFMGGQTSSENAEVYSLVKLLEIKFGTRLNFPDKLCYGGAYSYCSADEWAQAWMGYLEQKGHVKRDPWRPRSLGYEY